MEWHVPELLSILPIYLQLSLLFFFIGLLDLLWSLNTPVAACVSVVVGLVMFLYLKTTAGPALQHAFTRNKHLRVPQCPFKSPQSWAVYSLLRRFYGMPIMAYKSIKAVWTQDKSGLVPHKNLFIHNSSFGPNSWLADDSWLAYDIHWRSLRDAEHLSGRGEPITIRDSDDVVQGLIWINKTFTHSFEAIFPVYHSLAELDIPAAADTISEFYAIRFFRHSRPVRVVGDDTFKALMDDWSSSNEMQKRDIIAAFYLKLYQDRDPVLKTGYVETVIRILNTQEVPKSFYGWFSEILQDLASKPLLAPSVTTEAACQLNTNKIIIQTLMCVKLIITRDLLLPEDVAMAWTLLRQLLTLSTLRHSTHPIDSEPLNLSLGVNHDHIKLAGGLFEALKGWISQGKETYRERVKVCTEGMIRLFSSSIDIAALDAVCLAKAAGLVRALDEHMSTLGGTAAVLESKWDWSLDFPIEKTCEIGEWDSLVNNLRTLKQVMGEGGTLL